jgi:hypothetical protein
MTSLSNSSALFKPSLSSSSTGTAADGGWQRWWAIGACCCGSDWRTLFDCAETALARLRARHLAETSS